MRNFTNLSRCRKQLQREEMERQQQQQQQQQGDKGENGNVSVSMQTSGKLLEDTNVINGVVVKYSEPDEAKKPRTKWRLYVFKVKQKSQKNKVMIVDLRIPVLVYCFPLFSAFPGRRGAPHPVHSSSVVLSARQGPQSGGHPFGPPVVLKAARRPAVQDGGGQEGGRENRATGVALRA